MTLNNKAIKQLGYGVKLSDVIHNIGILIHKNELDFNNFT